MIHIENGWYMGRRRQYLRKGLQGWEQGREVGAVLEKATLWAL